MWSLEHPKPSLAQVLTLRAGESQVTEESMAEVAKEMESKKISTNSDGAVLVNFEELVPGKEGKRLGKAVVR